MKIKLDPEIRLNELIYCVALFCEVAAMLVSMTTIPYIVDTDSCNQFLKLLRYSGYLIVCIKMVLDSYKEREFISLCAAILLLAINCLFATRVIFLTFLFIFGMKNLDLERMLKYTFQWMAIGCLLIILGSQLGIIANWGYDLDSARPRYAIGFFYPSHATSLIVYIALVYIALKKDSLKLWHIIVLELFNYWQYKQTDSRTGSALLLLIGVTFLIIKHYKKDFSKSIFGFFSVLAFPVCAVVSVLACYVYPASGIWLKINSFVTNRLEYGHRAIQKYGIHLFGNDITWIGNGGIGHIYADYKDEYNYVDCSYVKLLLENGILIWILIITGFTLAVFFAVKYNRKYLAVALAFSAVYSIIEPRLMELGFNPFILTLVVLFDHHVSFFSVVNKVQRRLFGPVIRLEKD